MTAEQFRAHIQANNGRKARTTLPCHTEGAINMMAELADFKQCWPKIIPRLSDRNPHWRAARNYLHGEDILQVAFCAWLAEYHPSVTAMHPKNEGREGNVGRAKKKLMGVLEGAADLLLQHPSLPDCWMELKRRPNRPTPMQLQFLERQRSLGKRTAICYDLDQATAETLDWLGKTAP